jgi:glycosyltransferase involved in cell wall biosynthesis
MLSIIIPTYNEEKYLPRLLNSISEQPVELEVIVADNNSTDKTRSIAQKYDCKVVDGGSPGKGRNNGARKANGSILLFLDADVTLPDDFLIRALREFKKRKLDIATCLFKLQKKQKAVDNLILSSGNMMLYSMQFFDPHATGAFLLCKKKLFIMLGGFNEKLKQAEDHDFVKRADKIGKFGVLNKGIYIDMRRFEREGRLKVLKKYLKSELYRKVNGDIDIDIFDYEYGKF